MANPQGKLEFDVVLKKLNFLLVKIIKILETYGWLLNESECICLKSFQLPMTFYLIVGSVQFYSVEIL